MARRGYPHLLHQGYEYVSHSIDKTQRLRLWRCCRYQYHEQVCGASAVLEACGRLTLVGVHNHLPAKIIHDGFEYLFEETDKNNQKKSYRCCRYLNPSTACMARVIITNNGDLTLVGSHDHLPDKCS